MRKYSNSFKDKKIREAYNAYANMMMIEENRKPEHVASRAAFCKVARGIGIKLASIGYAMGKNHATVIHLLRNAEDKYYNSFKNFHNGLDVATEIFKDIDMVIPKDEEQNLKMKYELKRAKNVASSVVSRNHSLVKAVDDANNRMREASLNLMKIKTQVAKANKKLMRIDTSLIDFDLICDTESILTKNSFLKT